MSEVANSEAANSEAANSEAANSEAANSEAANSGAATRGEGGGSGGGGAAKGDGGAGGGGWRLVAFKIAFVLGLPFAALSLFLALHKIRRVAPVEGLTYEATLILNLVLYWLLLTAVVLAVKFRRPLGGWLRSQAPQIALLVFSLVLSLAFCEVAVRLLRPDLAAAPFERLASAELHHVNAPDRSSLGMGNQRVKTNADGLRTAYSRDDFLAHDQRIVLLGDSYTFGLGVAGDEAVGSVLEERLRRHLEEGGEGAEASVAVLNTGVISYSPYLERLMFRHVAAAYRPTTTLLLLDINDIGDDYQYRRENVAGPGEEPRFDVPEKASSASLGDAVCELSALCRALGPLWERLGRPLWVARRVFDLEEESYDYYDFKIEIGGQEETNRFFVLRYPLEDSRPLLDATWRNVEAVAREVEAAGSEFVLVVMPRYFHWNDAECPNNWEQDRYGVDEPYEDVFLRYFDERAAGAQFPVWSLLPAFEVASVEGPLVFDHDPHWNRRGHRAAGEALAEWLIAGGWPPPLESAVPRLSYGVAPRTPVAE